MSLFLGGFSPGFGYSFNAGALIVQFSHKNYTLKTLNPHNNSSKVLGHTTPIRDFKGLLLCTCSDPRI